MSTPTAESDARLASLLPDAVLGWRPAGEDQLFGRDDLFDLIDGGAEVYRALNVQRVLSRGYAKDGAAEILVDLFDMGSPSDAFGAYHFDMREEPEAGVGAESEYQGGSLFFWKHRYYASIVGLSADQATREAVFALGHHVARAIPGSAAPPDLVRALPATGVVRAQLYYFHSHESLSRRLLLDAQNTLGLGAETEGLLLPFEQGGLLLLLRYPSPAAAGVGLRALAPAGRAGAGAGGARAWPSRRRGWCAARRRGRLLVAVLDAEDRAAALRLLGTARLARLR